MATPTVSVITVAYNARDTIEHTLRSVRSQQGVAIEHIVVDGASRDGTLDVIRSSPHPPDVLISEPDRGVYDAMNKGVARATGTYVGFLNADDFFASDTALAQLLDGEIERGTDCVYGDIELVKRDDESAVVRRWITGPFSPLRARLGWQAPHPALYVRRDCFVRWGAFDASMRISADYELALRFLLKHSASWAYRSLCVARMRIGGQSTRSITAVVRGNLECRRAWRQNQLSGGFLAPFLKPVGKIRQLRLSGRNQYSPSV